MSREEKQLARLRDFQRDQSWDFAELCGLLQRLGFEMRISGMRDVINLQPQSGRAKPYQVRQVRKTLEANGML